MIYKCFLIIVFIGLFCGIPFKVPGQYFDMGQDPASIKWRQIETSHFRLVYPESFEPKASQLVNTLDFVYKYGTKTLTWQPKKVPVIIHSFNTISNAVTSWAPKRIDMFTTPPQDSYAHDWFQQLAIHEYRHVAQLDRANQGFTKVLSWVFGEQGTAMIIGLYVPLWFMEGDAVCTETALSHSGRGRIPSFEMPLRAQVMQKGAFCYDKATLGSYKTYVPNHYTLGYSLVSNVRRKYGYQSWVSALDMVARKPYLITPFNKGLKSKTTFGKEDLYRNTISELDSLWKSQHLKTSFTTFKQLNRKEGNRYENYTFPYYLNDTTIIAQLNSLDDITRIVSVTGQGSKKVISTPGFLSSDKYSICRNPVRLAESAGTDISGTSPNPLIVWSETINDYRWEERNYSVIRVFNFINRKTESITTKSRYFSPAISADGNSVAVACVDEYGRNSILLINTTDGAVKDTVIASDTDFYMTPSWSGDGSKILFTTLNDKGKSLVIMDLNLRKSTIVLQPTFTEISNPVFADKFVLFNGSYSGIENIYAIDLNDFRTYQVTSAEFGAANANLSPDGKRIVYSNYTSTGYDVVETEFLPSSWQSLEQVSDYSASLYKYLLKEETGLLDSTFVPQTQYKSTSYIKAAHIFNFHSWAPVYFNYMAGENSAGISFMSQNELGTAFSVVGYSYDMAENTGKMTADFSWKAWYPIIDLKTSYGARASYTSGDSSERYTFNEAIVSAGVSIPLIFTGGKYYKGLRFQLHTSLNHITNNNSTEEDKLTGTINSLDYSINAYRYIKQSYKDVYPRWGQTLTSTFRHSPFGDNNMGSIFSVSSNLYFPGVIIHHGIKVSLSYQQKETGDYAYNNQIYFPRGYMTVNAATIGCYAFNYKFPFLYPDFSLGPVLYVKRLKANLFNDGGIAVEKGVNAKMQSIGVELTADFHLFRLPYSIDLGYRSGYKPIEKQYFGDLLFSVNL